jgi:hypothetical protein
LRVSSLGCVRTAPAIVASIRRSVHTLTGAFLATQRRPIRRRHTRHLLNGEFKLLPWHARLPGPALPALHTFICSFRTRFYADRLAWWSARCSCRWGGMWRSDLRSVVIPVSFKEDRACLEARLPSYLDLMSLHDTAFSPRGRVQQALTTYLCGRCEGSIHEAQHHQPRASGEQLACCAPPAEASPSFLPPYL